MTWDRRLWGVAFTTQRDPKPTLIGEAWSDRQPTDAPTRALLFTTRAKARDWCASKMSLWSENTSLMHWRVRPVRVRERVEVAP